VDRKKKRENGDFKKNRKQKVREEEGKEKMRMREAEGVHLTLNIHTARVAFTFSSPSFFGGTGV
jgi:hypothetical protein